MIMIIITTDCVPGRDVREILGVVQGSTVRAKHLGRDIMAGLKNIVGGELRGYTELMREAREEAWSAWRKRRKDGADAVLNVRLATAAVTGGAAEILAYGTAVRLDGVATAAWS
ncbi:YbjQ family protein [Iodidimonas gelatinilytica]